MDTSTAYFLIAGAFLLGFGCGRVTPKKPAAPPSHPSAQPQW